MPVAESYTELELATLMHETIGADMAATLQWTEPSATPGNYTRSVSAALRLVGATDIADVTDMDALEAAARLAVWTLVMQHTAHLPATSAVETGADLSSIHTQAREQVKRAKIDGMRVGIAGYAMTSQAIRYTDIYGALEETS